MANECQTRILERTISKFNRTTTKEEKVTISRIGCQHVELDRVGIDDNGEPEYDLVVLANVPGSREHHPRHPVT